MQIGKKYPKFFLAEPFFCVLQLNVYQSAKSWLRAWVYIDLGEIKAFFDFFNVCFHRSKNVT